MKIAVAYDNTEGARKAAQAAAPIARASNATLVLIHVLNPRADLHEFEGSHEEALNAATRKAEGDARDFGAGLLDGVEVRVELQERGEDPGETLARVVREQRVDLIATATRRAGGLSGFFLGSVTQQLIQESSCPVMVVRV